jgi:hypothetical protein
VVDECVSDLASTRNSSIPFCDFRLAGSPTFASQMRARLTSTKIFVDNYEGLRIWFVHEDQAKQFTEADRGGT